MTHHWKLNGTQLTVNGNLDRNSLTKDGWALLSTAQQAELTKSGKATILFEQIDHVDSAGLAWVLNWVKDATENGIKLVLENVPSKLIQLARLSSVAELLPIQDD